MTKRLLATTFALTLLFAACGSGDDTDPTAAGGSPGPTATADGGGSEDGNGEPDGGSENGSGTNGSSPTKTMAPETKATAAPKATPAPVQTAKEGTINRPRAGPYTYQSKGTAKSPQCANPNGCPFDTVRTDDITYSGDVMSVKTTSEEDSGATTTRYKWETSKLTILQIKTDTQAGSFGCTFEKPVTVAKFPLKVEDYGKQTFKGQDCSGSVTIKILGQETVKDDNGKSWKTWKIDVKTEFDFGSITGTTAGVQWNSPDLGWEIRGDESTEGTATGFGPTPIQFSAEAVSTLKSHP